MYCGPGPNPYSHLSTVFPRKISGTIIGFSKLKKLKVLQKLNYDNIISLVHSMAITILQVKTYVVAPLEGKSHTTSSTIGVMT